MTTNYAHMTVAYWCVLIAALLRQWAPLFRSIKVVPVGGNHGERRSGV